MGARGPQPKPAAQRRRVNKPAATSSTTKTKIKAVANTHVASPEWHPTAIKIFDSLEKSGQSALYQESDWALAWAVCESFSRDMQPQVVGVTDDGQIVRDYIPLKGSSLNGYNTFFASIGLTEGARRRLGIELVKSDYVDPNEQRAVASITAIRARRNA